MPTYDYQCRDCGTVTEVIHSMLEDGPSVCERCGGSLRRVLFPTGIIFKGPGFYRNDSRAPASDTAKGSDSEKKVASTSDASSSTSGSGSGTSSETGTSGSTSPKVSSEP